jgi:hypothetical protein
MPAVRRTDEPKAKPRSDTYVGLLVLSLLALTAAMLFAYLNWESVKEEPKQVPAAPSFGGGGARQPAQMQGGPAVNPQGAAPKGPGAPTPPPPPQPPGNPPQQQK